MLPFDAQYPDALDSKLVALAGEGSRDALGILLSLHDRFIYNVAVRMLGDLKRSEIFTTETLVKAILNIQLIPKDGSFKRWLYSQVVEELMLQTCKTDPKDDTFSSQQHICKSNTGLENGDRETIDKYLFQKPLECLSDSCLTDALFCLPAKQRLVFVLSGIFNLTRSQLSEIAGLTMEMVNEEFRNAEFRIHAFLSEQRGRSDLGANHKCSPGSGSHFEELDVLRGNENGDNVCDVLDKRSGQSTSLNEDLATLFQRQSFLKIDISKILVRSFSISNDIKDDVRDY